MPAKSYPLKSLQKVRDQALETAKAGLASTLQQLENAELSLREAKEAQDHHHEETKAEEARALAQADGLVLQRLGTYMERRRKEAQRLAEKTHHAQQQVHACEQKMEEARTHLATTRAEARVIENHRDDWVAEQKHAREKNQELEVEDQISQRAPRPK